MVRPWELEATGRGLPRDGLLAARIGEDRSRTGWCRIGSGRSPDKELARPAGRVMRDRESGTEPSQPIVAARANRQVAS